jgi:hypothetical protein
MRDLNETAQCFAEILEHSPQERDAILRAIKDPELRKQLRSLIAADRSAVHNGFMDLVH